ncbi:serine--tRNA ligase [Candidatus Bathyarchaeota archaeon A05DMB-2]|jgi:seryl-tRNA synthetase|nr:serine--tRNA ligase [Candidatus Bathyarchaeota archaeon A05DMB-2]
MLDIKLIRENPQFVKENLAKRGNLENDTMLDELIRVDREWRQNLTKLNDLRHERKLVTIEIAKLKKARKNAAEEVNKAKAIDAEISTIEKQVAEQEEKTRDYLMRLPNLLHETVPFGKDESDNVQIRTWGKPAKFSFPAKNHIDLAVNLDIVDVERASKVAGARFFFLKGKGVLLDIALMNFAMEELVNKGYQPVEPPYLMKREPYEGVTALSDFGDVLYKIENEDLYLIATSEHPMAAMYMNEVFKEEDLPLKLAGVSACFRKEAGAHGKDTRGIFRTHQFNKIEQFIFCTPEQSWQLHEELLQNAEDLVQKLGLPYRVVNVCTGDIGTVAAKKYDIEAWMPAQNSYREIISCSNCTDYQARRLNIRYREKEGAPTKGFVHTLNSTAIATGRTIVALLENYQQEDGTITVPEALRKYMGSIQKISPQR